MNRGLQLPWHKSITPFQQWPNNTWHLTSKISASGVAIETINHLKRDGRIDIKMDPKRHLSNNSRTNDKPTFR